MRIWGKSWRCAHRSENSFTTSPRNKKSLFAGKIKIRFAAACNSDARNALTLRYLLVTFPLREIFCRKTTKHTEARPPAIMAFVARKIFLTKGVGKHRERLSSFELALRNAGIAFCNIVHASSIFPPYCKLITRSEC